MRERRGGGRRASGVRAWPLERSGWVQVCGERERRLGGIRRRGELICLACIPIPGRAMQCSAGWRARRWRGLGRSQSYLAMPHCFEFPEIILLHIFEHVYVSHNGRSDLASLALTCKLFSGPALDVLWRVQTSFLPLITTFPRELLNFAPSDQMAVATFVRVPLGSRSQLTATADNRQKTHDYPLAKASALRETHPNNHARAWPRRLRRTCSAQKRPPNTHPIVPVQARLSEPSGTQLPNYLQHRHRG